MSASDFHPSAVRFIRLGRGNQYAEKAIADGTLLVSHHTIPHELCAAGAWEMVRDEQIAAGVRTSTAARKAAELRDFYELDDDTLWITIFDGHLYWCFAEGAAEAYAVEAEDDPRRFRRTRDGWHHRSLTGEPLLTDRLKEPLTKLKNYRQTISGVKPVEYLFDVIRHGPTARQPRTPVAGRAQRSGNDDVDDHPGEPANELPAPRPGDPGYEPHERFLMHFDEMIPLMLGQTIDMARFDINYSDLPPMEEDIWGPENFGADGKRK